MNPRIASPIRLAALILPIALSSGCAYVGAGIYAAIVANQSSSDKGKDNAKPVVSLATPTGAVNDLIEVPFQLIDQESDPVNLTVEFSTDGIDYAPATEAEGAGSAGVFGLETAPGGKSYRFVWNSLVDLGNDNVSGVRLRITPKASFRSQVGEPAETAPFTVFNAYVATVAGGVVGTGLNFPNGVAVDFGVPGDTTDDVVYVADTFNNRVICYDAITNTTSVVAGTGEPGFNGDNLLATEAKLSSPFDVLVDGDGNVLIADSGNHRIRMVDRGTGFISTIAGGGVLPPGVVGDGLLATQGALFFPAGMDLGPSGNLFVADAGHHRVRVVSRQAVPFDFGPATIQPFTIQTVAGTGDPAVTGQIGDGGVALLAKVGFPLDVAVDSQRFLFITQPDAQRVRVVNPTLSQANVGGVTVPAAGITTLAGTGIPGFSGDGGSPRIAALWGPSGIGVDAADNVYFVDGENQRIRAINLGVIPLVVGNITIAPGTLRTVSGTDMQSGEGDGGPASAADLLFPTRLVVDPGGNLLVAEGGGNRVRAINATATQTLQWGNVSIEPGDIDTLTISLEDEGLQFTFPARVVVDDDGDFFFNDLSDLSLGVSSANRIYRLDGETGEVTVAAGTGGAGFRGDGGPPMDAAFNFPADLALDEQGNLYIADTLNHRIRMINNGAFPFVVGNVVVLPGVIETVAGAGVPGLAGDGAPPTFALMRSPIAIDLDDRGNIFIAEQDNHMIRVVNVERAAIHVAGTTIQPGTIRRIAGDGIGGFGGDGGAAATARLNSPLSLTVDDRGNIIVADTGNFRVRAINVGTSLISLFGVSIPPGAIRTVVGTGFSGSSGDGASAVSARVSEVRDVTLDPQGNLWLADSLNHRIRVVNGGNSSITRGGVPISPGFIGTVVGSGRPGFNGDALSNLDTSLNEPTGFGLLGGGNVVLADSANAVLRMVNLEGDEIRIGANQVEPLTVRTIAGSPGGQGGGLVVAPAALAEAPDGRIVFSDTATGNNQSHRIIGLDPLTRATVVVGGSGSPGYAGDDGPVGAAVFHDPLGVAIDGSGNIFIADGQNQVIRVINGSDLPAQIAGVPNIEPGNIVRIAGLPGVPGFNGNGGSARDALLRSPSGVAVDANGNVFVADTGNHQVRRILTNGTIERLSGEANAQPGTIAGEFDGPTGLYLDGTGMLLVADTGNHRVQEVNTMNRLATIIVGNPSGTGGFNGDGLAPDAILLEGPLGVAVDARGDLFVVDTGNHRLLVLNRGASSLEVAGVMIPPGIVRRVAGTSESGFNGDALPAPFTALSSPTAVLVDSAGDVYVSDTGNRRVRRFAK